MSEPKNPVKALGNARPGKGLVKKRSEELSDYVFGKVPPQAMALEEAVLGALMLDKDAMSIVLDILQPDSFYTEAHQLIFQAMHRLFEHSQPIDLLTVMEQLKKTGDLETVGGPAYLASLTNKVASAANIEFHARIISQKFIQRELIRVSTNVIREAFEDTTDVFDLLDSAEQGLFSIAEKNMSRGYEAMSSLASKVYKQLQDVKDKEDGLTGIPSGFTELDRLTSGWQPSDLIIIAARPGMGKCLGKGTKVLLYDGTLKKVEDIRIGDLLMGDDNTPRRVLTLARGQEQMYWIRQNKGINYRVNESHILSLKKSRQGGKGERGEVLDISVRAFLAKSPKFRNNYKGFKVAVEFADKNVPIAPYFLGLWLGDGRASDVRIASQDEEVVEYLEEYSATLNLKVHRYEGKEQCPMYGIMKGDHLNSRSGFSLQDQLRKLNLINNKHIPQAFLINSTAKRLELLAGLLDSDGHYLVQSNGYEITQKKEELAQQIKFLCDSLGFRTSLTAKKASISDIGYETTVYRVRIYGDIDKIPVRVKRKQANPWKSVVDWQVTGITIEKDIVDDYYGFEIDGNGRFLLEDMTVTHNTAFVLSAARNTSVEFGKGVAIFSLEMSSVQLALRMIAMEAEVSSSKLRNGQFDQDESVRLNAAIERIGEAPIFIDDTAGINIFELRAKCRRMKMQHDIQLIIIDYLQLMSGGGDNQRGNREQEVSAISRALKALAKELNVPVIALSQLSRAVEVRGGSKRPQLSDLRESGCLTGDTLIQDAKTGNRITIKELAEKETVTDFQVLAVNACQQIRPYTLAKAFYSGQKQVFELKTRTGRRIKASANHPFLKLEGWTALEELSVGDQIGVPRKIEVLQTDNPLSDDELILLAHLIGDGCILPKQPYHYTSADEANIAVVNESANKLFGIQPRIVPQENWWHTYLPSPYRLTHGKQHPITAWYNSLGLERVRSYLKYLPNKIFQCAPSKISLFLHHLWATDGNISWKKLEGRKPAGAIYYATSSQLLAEQVQHLLLRLGIISTVTIAKQKGGKYRNNYHVKIQGSQNQLLFLKTVGCFGKRGDIVPALIATLEDIEGNPNTDVLPKEAWDVVVYPAMQRQGLSYRNLFDKLEQSYSGSIKRNGISKERLQHLNEAIADPALKPFIESDILWDEIIEITPLGMEDVYDLTVPEVHNFVANDILVHNSIEQDADIVSFIYRPEYYGITEDPEGQSLKGVAEIIVAKHRNGALKDVRLRFTDQFARFSDLDDTSFGDFPFDTSPADNSASPGIITRPSRMNEDEDIPF